MLDDDCPVPSLQENEREEDSGDGEKMPESSPHDSCTLSSEVSIEKYASATRTSFSERGRRDLERINDDCCTIQL